MISFKSDLNICSRTLTTRFIWRRFETHITWELRMMRLSVFTVWKKELNVCSIYLLSKANDVRSVLCSIEKWRIVLILILLSLRCKWYSFICFFRSFDKISFKKKKISSQFKKKITISIKQIIKIVSLIFETFSLVFENSIAVTEFSNLVMFDALKRSDFFFVDFEKRQIFSSFVVFSFLFFHRNKSSFLIAFFFFELIRINRKFAHFKEKMYSNFSVFEKKIAKIATNVTQFSIVFDDLKRAMKMLKDRLLTTKKLIKDERMLTLFSEIKSERKVFVFRAEIADERIVTIESDHENQKDK